MHDAELAPGPHTPRGRLARAAGRWLVALLIVACNGDGTGPSLPPRISIVPEAPVAIYAGDTLTVRGTIRNSPYVGVSYTTSDSEVAAVDELSGLVTGIGPGSATITAVWEIDPRLYAELPVTVLADLPAALTLSRILDGAGNDAVLSAVQGGIDVRLLVQRGNARKLQVLLRDQVVCEESYPAPADAAPPPATVACTVDTGQFEQADGVPRFPNGSGTLSARLLVSGNRVLAESEPVQLTLANSPRLVTEITAGAQANDAGGNGWITGDVTVQVRPVVYEPGAAITWVSLGYRTPAGVDTTSTDGAAPFAVTLSAAGILKGVTDPAFQVGLSSGDAAGQPGPAGSSAPLRYDGTPPRPGTLLARDWIGAKTFFAGTYSYEGESDAGVGGVQQRFFAGDPGLNAAQIVAAGHRVVIGSDLAQAARHSYRLALQLCDALENCTLVDGFTFGVDLTPPLVETFSLPDRAVNPGADLVLGLRDDLSGFPARPLEVYVTVQDADAATATCGPTIQGIDLPGKVVGSGCTPDTLLNPVPVPRTAAGYYTYNLVAFDSAGNRSAVMRRTLLVDVTPPSVATPAAPVLLTPGEEMTVSVDAADNLDLVGMDFRLTYPGAGGGAAVAVPLAPPVPVGTRFDEVLTPAATAVGRLPFVRTLTYASAVPTARPTVLVDSLRVIATDAAGLTASARVALPRASFGNDTSTVDPFPRFSTAVTSADRTSVCTAGCGPGDATLMRIATRVDGETGTGRPFARIHFYRRSSSGELSYISSLDGAEAIITNTGTQSSFVYTLEHVPPPGLIGDFTLLAVGVTSRGNALITPLVAPAAPAITFYAR